MKLLFAISAVLVLACVGTASWLGFEKGRKEGREYVEWPIHMPGLGAVHTDELQFPKNSPVMSGTINGFRIKISSCCQWHGPRGDQISCWQPRGNMCWSADDPAGR